MTEQAFQILQTLFSTIWRLFTGWHIPGTNLTPAVFLIGSVVFVVVVHIIKRAVGGTSGGDD